MNKKLKTIIKWGVSYPIVIFLCFEVAVRILGYGSFYNIDYSIKCSPKNAFIGHDKLGIQLNPGTYSISINNAVHFVTNHELGKHRRVPGNVNPESPDLLFLGCSFTYGYGVNDDDNFPSLIQKEFPDLKMRNSGVIGYGTIQSLIQLKEVIKGDNVKTVLLNFSSFHFMRNTLSQAYRANLRIGYQHSSSNVNILMSKAQFPYKTSCESKIQYEPWESMYSNWTGREWFASINWMQSFYDNSKDNNVDQVEITACIIKEMAELCEKNKIRFGVVCLDSSAETRKLKKKLLKVNWIDIHFNFKSKKLTNLPHDSHPNKRGHKLIAKRISSFLKDLLNEE